MGNKNTINFSNNRNILQEITYNQQEFEFQQLHQPW